MTQSIDDLLVDKEKENSSAIQLNKKLTDIKEDRLEKEAQQKAADLGLEYIALKGFPISQEAISLINDKEAQEMKLVCFALLEKSAKLATTDIDNEEVNNFIEKIKAEGKKVDLYFISQKSFDYAFGFYASLPKIREKKTGVKVTKDDIEKYKQEDLSFSKIEKIIKGLDTSDKIVAIISTAIQVNASDIHIEAQQDGVKIRYRIDGVLNLVASLESNSWSKIVSRIKLISGLKINITDKPQDGRFTIHLKGEEVDVRVSTIPTSFGESVVMRLLKATQASMGFDSLGIKGRSFVDLEKQIKRPNGMIITTGPTGSGKTTTLYGILRKLNSPENKIITLEDPIEYKLEGINQSQIKKDKDYNFASGLKSILRQDPDIVMVGEIRDLETADTAINAALTGHLVISTLHTNSAAAAIPRFLAMGVKGFLLSPSLNAIIGQRLVRKVCKHCKKEVAIDNEIMTQVLNILGSIPDNSGSKLTDEELNNLKFYKGEGCQHCHGLGYKGRIGIYEILIMSQEIEKTILDNKVSEYIIQSLAQENGMITMLQDGLLKAKDGITTIEEVFRAAD
ncbi:GspE/PulE family protein [bacterium]|nr:GspE/PulE family protein [bacterium]